MILFLTNIGIEIKKQIIIPISQEFLKKISTAYYRSFIISLQNDIYSVLFFGSAF